eukprot:1189858-Prorocentrum_minimum.AAC.6
MALPYQDAHGRGGWRARPCCRLLAQPTTATTTWRGCVHVLRKVFTCLEEYGEAFVTVLPEEGFGIRPWVPEHEHFKPFVIHHFHGSWKPKSKVRIATATTPPGGVAMNVRRFRGGCSHHPHRHDPYDSVPSCFHECPPPHRSSDPLYRPLAHQMKYLKEEINEAWVYSMHALGETEALVKVRTPRAQC